MKTPELAAVGRVARRTARRNWKRTALIVALIAVPVAASQIAAGMIAASKIAPEEYATQQLGTADVLVQSYAPTAESMAWVDEQLDVLVPSAERLRFRNAYGAVPDATNYVEITDLDITAPLAKGKLGLVAGSVPDQPGEIALSDGLQLLSGASLGDEFTLAIDGLESEWQFTVVGTVRDVLYRNKSAAVITTADMDAVYAGSTNTLEFASRDAAWLIGAPEPEFVAAALSSSWELDRQDFRSKPLCVKSEFESVWGASDRIPLGVGV